MKVTLARKIDLVGGYVLCSFLRVVHALRPKRQPVPPPAKVRHVLVAKCFGFGSILQLAPMMSALKQAHPEARITLLTFAQNAGVARLVPAIDEVALIEFRKGFVHFALDAARQMLALRRKQFDAVFDCEFFSYFVTLMCGLIRRPETITVGFYKNRRASDWFFSHTIAIDLSYHISALFCRMLIPLGLRAECPSLSECGIAERAEHVPRRNEAPTPSRRTIVVNINASDLCLNRRWPPEHYEALIRMMLDAQSELGAIRILLVGGAEDTAYVGAFAKRIERPEIEDLSGTLSLDTLAATIREADLFIGSDSGPLHLAVACGTPSVSFFGPETPALYGPRDRERHRVLYAGLHCSPCLNVFYSKDTHCRDNVCMKSIAPESAFDAVRELLAPGNAGAGGRRHGGA
ncbi:MAG TPA: glycosyltransferase family 9 protein [Candidatus Hydrogenedentes bacterium]|nr:glycosyltransferase family 9 protein [Candidatus Hydrogenedentota bacterium]HPG67372.1 glycosyltransferase family 9 protein [Candidatus Hydrogenedentota bacterium]